MPNTTQKTGAERRARRSGRINVATHYQLEQVTRDFAIEGCVLADDLGNVVARSTGCDGALGHTLAAITPKIADGKKNRNAFKKLKTVSKLTPSKVEAKSFEAGGRSYCVAVIGKLSTSRSRGLEQAIAGIRRIYAERAGCVVMTPIKLG